MNHPKEISTSFQNLLEEFTSVVLEKYELHLKTVRNLPILVNQDSNSDAEDKLNDI